ncbi:MAG: cation:proton antiporter [Amphritea sp.]
MEFYVFLLILLLVTRLMGEIAYRLGESSLIGELLGGIALGGMLPFMVQYSPGFAEIPKDNAFTILADLGMFFMMLYGGVELRSSQLVKATVRSFGVAFFGLILPLFVGFGLSWLYIPDSSYKLAQCLFVGVAMAITAVPVSIRILMDLGQLQSPVGRTIIVAAIIDDVLSLILMAFVTAIVTLGHWPDWQEISLLSLKVAVFFLIIYAIWHFIVPRVRRVVSSLHAEEFEFSSLLLAALTFAVLAESLGLHFILGAFAAGLFFERRYAGEKTYTEVKKRVSGITSGFLGPIFFASIGLNLDLSVLTQFPVFLLLLITVAFLTKLVGAGVPAYLSGLSPRESLTVGVGMSARGAVELILADIALSAGLFSNPQPTPAIVASLFSCIVVVSLVTTLLTPVLLKRVISSKS